MEEANNGGLPASGIKDYIISQRKINITDEKIIENLRKARWPDDVIAIAVKEADAVTPAVTEVVPQDVFTKPPAEIFPPQTETPKAVVKERRNFSFLSLIALLFSPIPFFGLGIAGVILEHINKKRLSGGFLAVLAILINVFVIMFLFYIIWQIFTLPPDKLSGFAKAACDILPFCANLKW